MLVVSDSLKEEMDGLWAVSGLELLSILGVNPIGAEQALGSYEAYSDHVVRVLRFAAQARAHGRRVQKV